MADYAGAVAAIKALMVSGWGQTTPVAYQNENAFDPGLGESAPWVYFEILGNGSNLLTAGNPTTRYWLYTGVINVHVFVPLNKGVELAQQLAVQAGEVFRGQAFYDNGNGPSVRTWSPRTDGGASADDVGQWFRVTTVIPFEYFHRG